MHRLVSGAPNPTAVLGERLIFVKQIAITSIHLCKFQRIARISYKGAFTKGKGMHGTPRASGSLT